MAEHSNMRASEADRAQIVDHLRRATDEGRLLVHQFDERVEKALCARTYGELDAIVADLPRGGHPAKRPRPAEIALRPRPARIAMTAGALAAAAVVASLSATGVRTSRPSVRPPIASRFLLASQVKGQCITCSTPRQGRRLLSARRPAPRTARQARPPLPARRHAERSAR
jgi:hypothetical protein